MCRGRPPLSLSILVAFQLVAYGSPLGSHAATIAVTTTNDSGAGSLRQGILTANANPGPDTIVFELPNVLQIIRPTSPLPTITDGLVIDGYSQAGTTTNSVRDAFNGILLTQIDGTLAGNGDGFRVATSNTIIRGLIVTGFRGQGIDITATGTCTVEGNLIGIDSSNVGRGNTVGIRVQSTGNLIGGVSPASRNLIAFQSIGVAVIQGTNNAIRGNSIFANTSLGIDIGSGVGGVTLNDPGDVDTGPNFRQNFPVIDAAVVDESGLHLSGGLESRSNTLYYLEFFANDECDASGFGEGRQFVAATNVVTGPSGLASFSVDVILSRELIGPYITATATDVSGNSSEFSSCIRATGSLPGRTFQVTSTNDSGAGSLREAIALANLTVTARDTISFDIPGEGLQTIRLRSALPPIIDDLLIDGYTQPGSFPNSAGDRFDGRLLIQLEGSLTPSPFAPGLEVRSGVSIIRGLVITGFRGDGIAVLSNATCTVEGNWIGYSPQIGSGTNANGIRVSGSKGTVVGGVTPMARNLLSGNLGAGILLVGAASNTVIQGNFIGLDITATNSLPNRASAIVVSNSAPGVFPINNRIGGVNPGEGNSVGPNLGGVRVFAGTNNSILGNLFFENFRPIVLGAFGSPPNDLKDIDTGPNQLQNYPVITNAVITTNGIDIFGSLNSTPNAQFGIDFYGSERVNNFFQTDGRFYLGYRTVVTDTNGDVAFTFQFPGHFPGRYVASTATDAAGNTSEFSRGLKVESALAPVTFIVSTTNDTGEGSLRDAILSNNRTFRSVPNRIEFAIPGAGPHSIRLATPLPGVRQSAMIDGYTQNGATENNSEDGFNGSIMIQLDGRDAGPSANGLELLDYLCTLRGLAIVNFRSNGVYFGPASDFIRSGSNIVSGCLVGLEASGRIASNGRGVLLSSSTQQSRLGGLSLADRNVISGNRGSGVLDQSLGGWVAGNLIGVGFFGTNRTPNLGPGIEIRATDCIVGFDGNAGRNVIAYNQGAGVAVYQIANKIFGNSIFENDGHAIELSSQIPQPRPVLTSAATHPDGSTVEGYLQGYANTQFRLEFFENDRSATPDKRDGTRFLGATNLLTDASGIAKFTFRTPLPLGAGKLITANATGHSTSEFSEPSELVPYDYMDLMLRMSAPTSVTALGSNFTYTVALTNRGPDGASNIILNATAPVGLRYVGATASQGACAVLGNDIRCDLLNLPRSGTASVELMAVASRLGLITNRVEVSTLNVDAIPTNNVAFVPYSAGAANLAVGLGRPLPTFTVGIPGSMDLVVTNLGPDRAENVTLRMLSYCVESVTVSQGSFALQGGEIVGHLGILEPGQTASLSTVTTVQNRLARLSTTASALTPDPQPQNNYLFSPLRILNGVGMVSFNQSFVTVGEGQKQVTVRLMRNGTFSGSSSVEYFTTPDTATEGEDYEATSGIVTFLDGESVKFLTVALLEDDDAECNESFRLQLRNLTNCFAPCDFSRECQITIGDNDGWGYEGALALVSHSGSNPQRSANGHSSDPSMSSDGKFIAFSSRATDLTDEQAPTNGWVFIHDRVASTTVPIPASEWLIAAQNPEMSGDGRCVAFEGLTTNGVWNVCLYQRGSNTVEVISVVDGVVVSSSSGAPCISSNGNIVTFIGETADFGRQLFARDRAAGRTWMLTRDRDQFGAGNGSVQTHALSSDGTVATFSSGASNLTPEPDLNWGPDVFAHEIRTGKTKLISGLPGPLDPRFFYSISPQINADGRYVAFVSTADLVSGQAWNGEYLLYRHDLSTGLTQLISQNRDGSRAATRPDFSMSANGQRIAYLSLSGDVVPGDTNLVLDLFVVDLQSATTILANPACHGSFRSTSSYGPSGPTFSGDGSKLSFFSSETDLVSGVFPSSQTYWFDLDTRHSVLLSRNKSFTGGGNDYSPGNITCDFHGRIIAFDSRAPDLAAVDENMAPDVFVWSHGHNPKLEILTGPAGIDVRWLPYPPDYYLERSSPLNVDWLPYSERVREVGLYRMVTLTNTVASNSEFFRLTGSDR